MNPISRKTEGAASGSEKAGKGKKPYTKPAFRFERVFETSALSCSKNAQSSACQHHLPTKS